MIHTDQVLQNLRQLEQSCRNNGELGEYFRRLLALSRPVESNVMPQQGGTCPDVSMPAAKANTPTVKLKGPFDCPAPTLTPNHRIGQIENSLQSRNMDGSRRADMQNLTVLLRRLETSAQHNKLLERYIPVLQDSMRALADHEISMSVTADVVDLDLLIELKQLCEQRMMDMFNMIHATISHQHSTQMLPPRWPTICPDLLLRQFHHRNWHYLSDEWKSVLLDYGVACIERSRAIRMLSLARKEDYDAYLQELANVPHLGPEEMEDPEHLLLAIDVNVTIRPMQMSVARFLMASKENIVTQLNMGEGKTSIIVPLMALMVGKARKLPCVVTPKPQAHQTKHMLIAALSGTLSRKVYSVSFSREETRNVDEIRSIHNELQACLRDHDVIIIHPEDMNCLQLLAYESIIIGDLEVGEAYTDLQSFFDDHVSFIIDECDEVFDPRQELTFSMGRPQPIDHGQMRWDTMQAILRALASVSVAIQETMPQKILVSKTPGRYPEIQILDPDVANLVIAKTIETVLSSDIFATMNEWLDEHERRRVVEWITNTTADRTGLEAIMSILEEKVPRPDHPGLLLLHGLVANGTLRMTLLGKRVRVNYGLTSSRTPHTSLAVPYIAKDRPSPRSDYSNPEVIILLTSLSYYNSGLSKDQLLVALQLLSQHYQPEIIYRTWLQNADAFPQEYSTVSSVSRITDDQELDKIWPHFRYAVPVIDFFLANVVFVQELRAYNEKLCVSGWDLGKVKGAVTRGFSGTRDRRELFPFSLKHQVPNELQHTDALVLGHVLEETNQLAALSLRSDATDSQELLETICALTPSVEVILDVGALFLDRSNLDVARAWLLIRQDKQAAIYVNDEDRLYVVDTAGLIEDLRESPYLSRTGSCLVFLDEAHTRGTDIKLPNNYRAAVTVGNNLSKDKLMQGCMRMRKLAQGQRLTFCVPRDIQYRIMLALGESEQLAIVDLVHWTIMNTVSEIKDCVVQWATQGKRFAEKTEHFRLRHVYDLETPEDTPTIPWQAHLCEEEKQSLSDLYGDGSQSLSQFLSGSCAAELSLAKSIQNKLEDYLRLGSLDKQVFGEHEREREHEVQREQQHQHERQTGTGREPEPREHTLQESIVKLWVKGEVRPAKAELVPAFRQLRQLAAAYEYDTELLCRDEDHLLYVSKDFGAPVIESAKPVDLTWIERQVLYVVSVLQHGANVVDALILITENEASKLRVMKQEVGVTVRMHMWAPCHKLGGHHFDKLDFMQPPGEPQRQVPQRLRTQLELFGGSLWFPAKAAYEDTASFLCLMSSAPPNAFEMTSPDGFYYRADASPGSKLDNRWSPIPFLKHFLGDIRHHGMDIGFTHIGTMLSGRLLKAKDFD
ncbi:hypothetical protein AMS68_003217 [Peltaster fructicola]|uniref:ubiquitinyl hydrolase 1 n=1 Tax=Peltaster fructicola TaxID=286661 RepID=A0A6H0XTB7_9PEZI|nr:hypothetical protein AMS68_003217 [Peltaster fructicola]